MLTLSTKIIKERPKAKSSAAKPTPDKSTPNAFSPQTFSPQERSQMRALKGVGDTVIDRLEQVGFSSLPQLAGLDPLVVTKRIAEMMRSTCWHNSPLARGAVGAIVDLANSRLLKRN